MMNTPLSLRLRANTARQDRERYISAAPDAIRQVLEVADCLSVKQTEALRSRYHTFLADPNSRPNGFRHEDLPTSAQALATIPPVSARLLESPASLIPSRFDFGLTTSLGWLRDKLTELWSLTNETLLVIAPNAAFGFCIDEYYGGSHSPDQAWFEASWWGIEASQRPRAG